MSIPFLAPGLQLAVATRGPESLQLSNSIGVYLGTPSAHRVGKKKNRRQLLSASMRSLTCPPCSSPMVCSMPRRPSSSSSRPSLAICSSVSSDWLPVFQPHLGRAGRPGVQAELGDDAVVSPGRRPDVAGRDPGRDADLWQGAG